MPVPSSITDLSPVAGSNSPAGTETPLPQLDDYLRAISSFVRQNYDALQNKAPIAAAIPSGGIIAWSGAIASIPVGWALCDGTNGTPDLRNRFIIGAGSSYSVGGTGGAASVNAGAGGDHAHGGATGGTAISAAQMPAHSHSGGISITQPYSGALPNPLDGADAASFRYNWNNTGGSGSAGGGQAHDHSISASGTHTHSVDTLPPYLALAYIMKT